MACFEITDFCILIWWLQLKNIYPLAIINVVGNLLTNISLGKVAVSFTHTVKVRRFNVPKHFKPC